MPADLDAGDAAERDCAAEEPRLSLRVGRRSAPVGGGVKGVDGLSGLWRWRRRWGAEGRKE